MSNNGHNREDLYKVLIPEVEEFTWQHLAEIISKNIFHPNPRYEADGATAREYVEETSYPRISRVMARKFFFVSSYQQVRIQKPHMPELNLQSIVYGGIMTPEVNTASERLLFLSDDELSNIFSQISKEQRRVYLESFLGRDVWESFFQSLIHEHEFLILRGYNLERR